VHRLCPVLGVSRSDTFAWKRRPACRRLHEDMVLLAQVRSAFALSHGTYGSPRMTRERQDSGLSIGRRPTARLMRENGSTPGSGGGSGGPPTATLPGQSRPTGSTRTSRRRAPTRRGGSDIPFLWPREGWLDLAVLIDRFARRVVGWAGADRLHRALAALRKARIMRRPAPGLIHHADRGSQGGFTGSSQRLEESSCDGGSAAFGSGSSG
jgi:putative transposase